MSNFKYVNQEIKLFTNEQAFKSRDWKKVTVTPAPPPPKITEIIKDKKQ